jgi:hypothetical protein
MSSKDKNLAFSVEPLCLRVGYHSEPLVGASIGRLVVDTGREPRIQRRRWRDILEVRSGGKAISDKLILLIAVINYD